MGASLALPLALFALASAVSWVSTNQTADREIERTLDVAHEHALKVFETIDRSLSEIAEIVRGIPDADISSREPALHLRLKELVGIAAAGEIGLVVRRQGPCARQQPGVAAARDRFFRPRLFQGACRRRHRHLHRRRADAASALSGRAVLRSQPPPSDRRRQLRRRDPGFGAAGIFREFLRQDRPRPRQLLRARPDRRHAAGALSRHRPRVSASIARDRSRE